MPPRSATRAVRLVDRNRLGTALSAVPGVWLEQPYTNFMMILGALLVPIGGVLIAHFFVLRRKPEVADLYAPAAGHGGFVLAGVCGWIAGVAAYLLAAPVGGTLPSLAVAILVTALLGRSRRPA